VRPTGQGIDLLYESRFQPVVIDPDRTNMVNSRYFRIDGLENDSLIEFPPGKFDLGRQISG
jgi:hypothetical protein